MKSIKSRQLEGLKRLASASRVYMLKCRWNEEADMRQLHCIQMGELLAGIAQQQSVALPAR